jgi:hypothetical protein
MQIDFIPVPDGPFSIWNKPEAGEEYVIGIDTATGVGGDYTVMEVFTRTMPFKQAARFRAKCSVLDAGSYANLLGRYYNNALIICETNYPGNAVQDALIQVHQYPWCYQAEQHLDESPNVSTKFGFQTTQASKWLLIREFQSVLKNNEVVIQCLDTVDELGNYVYIEDKTKTGAAQGLNDDDVIATMLAIHGCLIWPKSKREARALKPSKVNLQHKAMMDKLMQSIREPQEEKVVIA